MQISGALHIAGTTAAYETGESVSIILNSRPNIVEASKIVWDTNDDGPYAPDAQIYESGGDLYLSASDDVRIRGEFGDVVVECADDMMFRPGDKVSITESATAGGKFFESWAQPSPGVFWNVLDFGDQGVVINEDGQTSYDLRVETDNLKGALLVDAGTNQVILGSDKTVAHVHAELGVDVVNFLSGTLESKGIVPAIGDPGGVTLVAGDLIVSGAIYESNHAAYSFRNTNNSDPGNSEYAVWASGNYPVSNPGIVNVLPAKGVSFSAANGTLEVVSSIQDTRHMLFAFTLLLQGGSSGPCDITIRESAPGGAILWQAPGVHVDNNFTLSNSFQVLLPAGSIPCLTVDGGGILNIIIKAGSTGTYRSIT